MLPTKDSEASTPLDSSVGQLDSKSAGVIALEDISSSYTEADSFFSSPVTALGPRVCRCSTLEALPLASTFSKLSWIKELIV
jgi:hypothetical protein